MQEREGRACQHALISADLAQRPRNLRLRAPCALERQPHAPSAFLEGRSRDLFRVGPRMGESDRHLERAGPDAELPADVDISRPGVVVHVGQATVRVAEVDLDVAAPVVTDSAAGEGADEADPDVLLLEKQRWRMRVDDAGKVALGSRLPVGRGLHVEAEVGQLRREGRSDQDRVLLRVGEELLGQSVFVVCRLDSEARHAGAEPADVVLAIE